jgi:hypothetical protein
MSAAVSSTTVLRDAALRPSTLRIYRKNLSKFLSHTRLSLQQLLSHPPSHIDGLLAAFIDHQYALGGSIDYCQQAVNALVFQRPLLKHRLGESRLRLRGWRNLVESHSHPPLTWELTVLFAVTMARWGCHAEAAASLLAFDCYLRVGEIIGLRYCDVIMPRDPRVGSAHPAMALRLARTKTGNNQWVSLRSPAVSGPFLHYLNSLGPAVRPDQLVFPFSRDRFCRLIHRVATALGVGHTPYVPHSFRHGGATCDFLRGHSIERIMFHGRWRSMESARRYIQTGRAIMATLDVPSCLNDVGAVLAACLPAVMDHLLHSVPADPPTRRGRRVHFLF